MRHLSAVCILAAIAVPGWCQTKISPEAISVQQIVLQLERDWTQAGLKKDYATLDKIIADDWVSLDYDGKTVTKAQSIANLKAGTSSTQSIELGPMKVRVFGTTAVVTGSDTEKSMDRGKDSSGKYVWTDIFVNRNNRWQAVASQSTKVDK